MAAMLLAGLLHLWMDCLWVTKNPAL